MTDYQPLPTSFYARDSTADVAQRLLGQWLVRQHRGQLTCGRIVETEAYLGASDPAAHSYRGESPRNRAMFGPAGHAYVYSIHAKYCVNVVCQGPGVGEAVLIRAIEPLVGLPQMRRRRGREKVLELARGPARLCQAMQIGPALDGWDLTAGRKLWIAEGKPVPEDQLHAGPRVGISKAREWRLRFAVANCRFVSLPRGTLQRPSS